MADFCAGYISGAIGILVGSPLDILKVHYQASLSPPWSPSSQPPPPPPPQFPTAGSLFRGAVAPILGYGALNALLFVSYNHTLSLLDSHSLAAVWSAGAIGGLVSFVVSSPTELVKCRAQAERGSRSSSSLAIATEIWRRSGVRGFYHGGGVTAVRDSVGYGFYFWSYETCKRGLEHYGNAEATAALKVLLCGGIAGCVTWLSIYPLDVIKTRVQTQTRVLETPLLAGGGGSGGNAGAWGCAKSAYRDGGVKVFFNGLGVCMARAFLVNAVQWAVYEWIMQRIRTAEQSTPEVPARGI